MSFYTHIARPILFLLPPEKAHNVVCWILRIVGNGSFGEGLLKIINSYSHPSLEREVFGIKFPNPIGVAAGFDPNATIYRQLGAIGFGFVEVGTITAKPQAGSLKPRLFRLPTENAMINRMGLPNQGLEKALNNLRRRGNKQKVIVGANIAKNTITRPENAGADYLKLFRNLYQYVDYFTINVRALIDDVKFDDDNNKTLLKETLISLFDFRKGQNEYRPILLKISPDWSKKRIDQMIELLIDSSLDGVIVAGTTLNMESLENAQKLISKKGEGGVSGAPLLKKTIELISYVSAKTERRFPIIGVGGVTKPEDAKQMLDAGANLVQIYTGMVYNGPRFIRKICRYLVKQYNIEQHDKEQQTQQ